MKVLDTFKLLLISILVITRFGTFSQVSIQVNETSGRVNANIPLCNVVSEDINYPIVLSYSQNGTQAGQFTGRVGYGWSLMMEGMITRNVMGFPDDFEYGSKQGWIWGNAKDSIENFISQSDNNVNDISDEVADYYSILNIKNGNQDTEPDLFTISAPGLYANFMFDNDGLIQVRPYQDLKIDTLLEGKSLAGFIVTTNAGIKYTFDRSRSLKLSVSINPNIGDSSILYFKNDYDNYVDEVEFNHQWYLTSISSNRGGSIIFNYMNLPASSNWSNYVSLWSPTSIDTVKYFDENNNMFWDYEFRSIESERIKLLSIETALNRLNIRDGQDVSNVDFIVPQCANYECDSISSEIKSFPIKLPLPLVNNIWIQNKGVRSDSLVKSISFQYQRFHIKPFQSGALTFFLKSIKTSLPTSSKILGHSFEYDQVSWEKDSLDLPTSNTETYDPYGFYNSGPDTEARQLYQYHSPTEKTFDFLPYEGDTRSLEVFEGKSNEVDFARMMRGMLVGVKSTTGASQYLSYSPNYYYDTNANRNIYGGGLRLEEVTTYDGIDNYSKVKYAYEDTLGKSTGIMIQPPEYAFFSSHAIRDKDGYLQFFAPLSSTKNIFEIRKVMTVRSGRNLSISPFSASGVFYEQVTISNELGKTVNTYYSDENVINQTQNGSIAFKDFSSAASGQYYYPLGEIDNSHAYPFSPGDQYITKHGLLETSKSYDANDSLLKVVEYKYDSIRSSSSIKAMRIEPSKVLAHRYNQVESEYEDWPMPSYIYDQYEIEVSNRMVLVETKSTYYEGAAVSTYTNYQVDTLGILQQVIQTLADSTILKKRFTYAYKLDYSSSTLGSEAIEYQRKNHYRTYNEPIETYESIQRPNESEYINGGSINTFNWITKEFIDNTYSIRKPVLFSNYTPLAIDTGGDLIMDSNYRLINQADEKDYTGPVQITSPIKPIPVTILKQNGRSIGSITNANSDEIAFSQFDGRSVEYHDFISNSFSDSTLVEGRVSENALLIRSVGNLHKTLFFHGNESYIFSFWAKGTSSSNLELEISSIGGDTLLVLPTSQASDWEYHEFDVDISDFGLSVNDTIRLEIDYFLSSLVLDDIAFYPQNAVLNYESYDFQIPTASTDNLGRTNYLNYDEQFGNVSRVTNEKHEIVSETHQTSNNIEIVTDPIIEFDGSFQIDVPKKVKVQLPFDLVGNGAFVTCHWAITSDTSKFSLVGEEVTYTQSSGSFSTWFTITEKKDYMIFVKVAHGPSGQNYYQKAFIISESIIDAQSVVSKKVKLCISGPDTYDLCEDEAYKSGSICVAALPSNGYNLVAFVDGEITGYT